MFRKILLVTTALIVVVSLSPASAGLVCPGKVTAHNANLKDANEEFLQNYGRFVVSGSSTGSSSFIASQWTHVAVPIAGSGKTVSKINVKEVQGAFTSFSTFSAGIYGNNASGFPGKLITGGQGNAPSQLGLVTVAVEPTRLKRNKTYWIEETVRWSYQQPTNVEWRADRKTKRRAYVQTHRWCSSGIGGHHSSSYTSPWRKYSVGPYVRLK
jgi:hypothetical protein